VESQRPLLHAVQFAALWKKLGACAVRIYTVVRQNTLFNILSQLGRENALTHVCLFACLSVKRMFHCAENRD